MTMNRIGLSRCLVCWTCFFTDGKHLLVVPKKSAIWTDGPTRLRPLAYNARLGMTGNQEIPGAEATKQ
jgi:hypothetical protein